MWSHHFMANRRETVETARDFILGGSKINIVVTSLITSWQVNGGKVEIVTDFIFLGSKITVDGDWSQEIKRHSLEESYDNLDSV